MLWATFDGKGSPASTMQILCITRLQRTSPTAVCYGRRSMGKGHQHQQCKSFVLQGFKELRRRQYAMGDVRWERVTSINNANPLYYKASKNFADGSMLWATFDGKGSPASTMQILCITRLQRTS